MKTNSTLFILIFCLITSISFAQKKNKDLTIISGKTNITQYYNHGQLNEMSKGDLLTLYIERIEVIVNILPNIAFSTDPEASMSSLGIPKAKDNRKALKENHKASQEYFDHTIKFQKTLLPYSDTQNLISAILFYEETLKSLHTYNDY